MRVTLFFHLIVASSLLLAGCDQPNGQTGEYRTTLQAQNGEADPAPDVSSNSQAGSDPAIAASRSEAKSDSSDELTTDEAIEILKKPLDAWAFGDSIEDFEKEHPNISALIGYDWSVHRYVLLRYEIGPARKGGTGSIEVRTTLVTQSKAGTEINEAVTFSLMGTKDKVLITRK